MLPREILGNDDADHRALYDALRFLVDRALLTNHEAKEGRLAVAPGAAGDGTIEVRACPSSRSASDTATSCWIPLFAIDELDFTFDNFVAVCPSSMADAAERATLGPRL